MNVSELSVETLVARGSPSPRLPLHRQYKDKVSCRCGVARKVLSIVRRVHGGRFGNRLKCLANAPRVSLSVQECWGCRNAFA